MSVVLECPVCGSAFQVLPENAGQLVACPSCNKAVAVPKLAVPNAPPAIPKALPTEPIVFNCGSCFGKFGVTPDMDGTQVACPHCDKHVLIRIESSGSPPPVQTQPPTSPEPLIPKIRTGRKKKKIVIPGHVSPPAETKQPESVEPPSVPSIKVGRRKKNTKSIGPPAVEKPVEEDRPVEKARPVNKISKSAEQVNRTFDDSESKPRESDLLPPVKAKESKKPSSSSKPETTVGKSIESKTKSDPNSKKRAKPKKSEPDKSAKAKSQEKDSTAQSKVENAAKHAKASKRPPSKRAKPKPVDQNPDPVVQKAAAEATAALVDRRLPPRFTVDDPDEEEWQYKPNLPAIGEYEVILPDGDGGYQRIDSRVVHVERNGEILELKAPTKESRAFNRMIQNVFSIGLGILILILAFWILIAW